MTNKTYRFATVVAVFLALLVFVAPVSAEVTELTPGIGVADKVTWISYSGDEQSYALWIHGAGEYKLMNGFNVSGYGINITVPGVTFDGNSQEIIANATISNGGRGLFFVDTLAENTVIKNLKITATVNAKGLKRIVGGSYPYGIITICNKTTLTQNYLDFSDYSDSSLATNVVYVFGKGASGTCIDTNTLLGAKSTGSYNRIVCIDGADNVIVKSNTITINSAKDGQNAMGIQTKGVGLTGTQIVENILNTVENIQAAKVMGISYTVASSSQEGDPTVPTVIISGNSFNLPSENTYALNLERARFGNPELKLGLTVTGNTFTGSDENGIFIGGVDTSEDEPKVLTLSGTISGNDFPFTPNEEQCPTGNLNFIVPTTPTTTSSSGTPTPGAYYNYPRTVTDGGLVEFGTSKVVKSVTLPAGSSGKVNLHIDSTAYWPLALDSEFTFDISVDNLGEGTSYISFKIDESKLTALELTAADVGVYHEVNGEWVKLVVTYTIEDGDVIYTAETDSFSPFKLVIEEGAAVQKEEEVTPSEPVTPPVETPDVPEEPQEILPPIDTPETPSDEPESPAPILAVLAGLGAAVVLRRK